MTIIASVTSLKAGREAPLEVINTFSVSFIPPFVFCPPPMMPLPFLNHNSRRGGGGGGRQRVGIDNSTDAWCAINGGNINPACVPACQYVTEVEKHGSRSSLGVGTRTTGATVWVPAPEPQELQSVWLGRRIHIQSAGPSDTSLRRLHPGSCHLFGCKMHII